MSDEKHEIGHLASFFDRLLEFKQDLKDLAERYDDDHFHHLYDKLHAIIKDERGSNEANS